ncbi:CACNA1H, partial [Symbiodinium pilosum]
MAHQDSEDLEGPASPQSESRHNTHTTVRVLGKEVVREKLRANQPFKAFVKKGLDSYMALVVLANLGCIIAMTEWTVSQTSEALGLPHTGWEGVSLETFEIFEFIFFAIYLVDVLLRIITLGREWYYDQMEGIMYLNIFDGVLVLINLFELVALPAMMVAGDQQQQQATTIRVIKLVRIVRTLRIFKTVSLFRQLRILVGTCVASIGALFWSMVLLVVLQIGFALAMCQALQLFILDAGQDLDTRLEMHTLYGSFGRALFTMFEITFSGSWPVRVRPVVEKVSVWYALPFLAYITFVVFAVIKIVTALFLKETLTSAANDADMVMEDARRLAKDYTHKLEELFRLADDDGDGNLSRDEFNETMSLPSVQHYLRTLDMSMQDCRPLFDILDDGDGLITITEFVRGLSQIKGQARAVDIVILQRENAKLMTECRKIRVELINI